MKPINLKYKATLHHIVIIFCILLVSCTNKNENLQFYIETDHLIDHTKQSIQIYTNTQQKKINGSIKTRGGFSLRFPKQSYELNLQKDISIKRLPKDDDWILNANFIDKTFLRHVFSYDLFQKMNKSNIAAKSKHIELFINHEYQGLYVLMEKLDRSSLKIQANDSLSMIFKDPHLFRNDYSNITPQKTHNFHQQIFPKISQIDKNSELDSIRSFILKSNDTIFQDSISKIFNLENIIDWHLLLLITNNSDGLLKNFYLYRQNNSSLLKISPWDYDHSFGRDGDNELNIDLKKIDIKRSILFERLLRYNWYKIKLKEKWNKLNNKHILTPEALKSNLSNQYQKIHELIEKNNQLWCIESHWYYDANNVESEISIMHQFIDLRHAELEKYFNTITTPH